MSGRGRAFQRLAAVLVASLLVAALQPIRTGASEIPEKPSTFTWTPVGAVTPTALVPDALVYGGGQFVLMGSVNNTGNPVWFGASQDGANWKFTQVQTAQELRHLAYGDGLFLAHWSFEAVGDVAVSTDAVNWKVQSMIPYPVLDHTVYGQGRFVGTDPVAGDILSSTDGFTWAPVPGAPWRVHPLDVVWSFPDLAFDGHRFVVTAHEWNSRLDAHAWVIFESPDGLNWSQVTRGSLPCARQIRYRNGRYVVAGYEIFHTWVSSSDNGQAWYPCTEPDPDFGGQWLYDIAGYFVSPDLLRHRLNISVDGITWWSEPLPADAGHLLAWGGGTVVLAGADAIYRSHFTPPGVFVVALPSYTAHGETIPMDVAPFIIEDRTYVPIRYLADSTDIPPGGIGWDEQTQTVTLRKGYMTVVLTIGSTVMYVNGEPTKMDVAPFIVPPGRVMLPARWVAEAFGYRVEWFTPSRTVLIRR